MLLNNPPIKKEIKGEIRKYSEQNENENTTCWSLWDAAKAVLREKLQHKCLHHKRRKVTNQ